jgi:2-oxo-4-hydroxy-4-carboxy--5-ureidoimidazoline (OHCU) decarboxylase
MGLVSTAITAQTHSVDIFPYTQLYYIHRFHPTSAITTLQTSTMTSLPPISSLSHSPDTTLTTVLDLLFEPSPPLHSLTLPILRSTTFPTYQVLITAVNAQLTALASSNDPQDLAKLSHILSSHPRLGSKKVDSQQSRNEQAQLQANDEQATTLADLNTEYEAKFPGLRYVYVFLLLPLVA